MRIGLVGYGKMGKIIETLAVQRGHEVTLKITSQNTNELNADTLKNVDVIIEFTNPDAAHQNVITCLEAGVPTVCGSTGWNDMLEDAYIKAKNNNTSFIWASNFSIGVNLYWKMTEHLAKIMSAYPEYDVMVKEIHHTQKKDAPSGTAITTAEKILTHHPYKNVWKLDEKSTDILTIKAERIDEVPGTHIINYSSTIDDISLTHTAHNRNGFALGAVIAAEYIVDKKGVFTMNDVLGL